MNLDFLGLDSMTCLNVDELDNNVTIRMGPDDTSMKSLDFLSAIRRVRPEGPILDFLPSQISQEDLCARFGVGDGVSTEKGDDTPGLPYIVWFKGGKEAGPYTGERTLAGLTAWVAEKQAAKEL